MAPTLKVRNWDKWQSYRRDRGQPPWIKVHREIMRNVEWVSLTDAQRGQLVAIWLLAADHDGVIPASPTIIKKLCFLDSEPDINLLISLGFLEGDANVTPNRRQHDVTETETEAKKETETETEAPPEAGRPTPTTIPPDWRPNEVNRRWLADSGMTERQQADAIGEFVRWASNSELRKANWQQAFSRNPAVKSAVGRAKSAKPSIAATFHDKQYTGTADDELPAWAKGETA